MISLLCEFSNWYGIWLLLHGGVYELFSGFGPVIGKAAAAVNLGVL